MSSSAIEYPLPQHHENCRMVCVIGLSAGVDNVGEQKKLEARKMPVNRADSHKSAARFVRSVLSLDAL